MINQESNASALPVGAYADSETAAARKAHGDVLAAATNLGAVTLHVGDRELMTGYYRDALALDVLSEGETTTVLGRGVKPLVILEHTPGLPVPSRREAGLFHTALLFETKAALSATVLRAAQHKLSKFAGSSDHIVSEAFYFTDPEGNGIELYWDRPREAWLDARGKIQMSTEFLDPNLYLRTHLDEATMDLPNVDPAIIGHVHLQVGSIEDARKFYVDTLGFEPTVEDYSGALFMSAGGYHHHIAANIWNSRGAGPRAATLGLGRVDIQVPERAELDAVAARLHEKGFQFADEGNRIETRDPWGSVISLEVAAA